MEPDSDIFAGSDLESVKKQPKFIKSILITMGIRNKSDQDHIIQQIKKMVEKDGQSSDVWNRTCYPRFLYTLYGKIVINNQKYVSKL